MQFRGLFQDKKFAVAAYITLGFVVLYLVWNILGKAIPIIGGDEAINAGNAIVSALAALFTSFLFFRASMVEKDTISRPIWLGMGLGFGLWGLADTIWAYYALVLQEEIPVPSLADVLWIIAYVPLSFALVTRYRKLKSAPTPRQYLLISAISLVILLLTVFFVLSPILADFDSQRAAEGITNAIYPVGDLLLFVLSCLILVLLQEGRFAMSWRLIAAGMLVLTLSDLVYSYAAWQGFYYPDGQANAISIAVDVTYTLAYVCVACGIYLYGLVREIKEKFSLQMEFAPSTRLYVFLATNAENQIIDASENFYCLVDGKSSDQFKETSLAEVFGLPRPAVWALFEKILREERLYYEPLRINTRHGDSRDIWLIAEANYDPQHNYAGSILVLIADVAVREELRFPKNPDIIRMMNHLIEQAGARSNDVSQAMRAYFLESVRLLSSVVYQFGGPHYRQALLESLKHVARQKELPVQINEGTITIPEGVEGQELAGLLTPLLQAARDYVAGYVGDQIVADELNDLESQMNPAALHALDAYRLRAYHLAA